jgi:hypothetical protein
MQELQRISRGINEMQAQMAASNDAEEIHKLLLALKRKETKATLLMGKMQRQLPNGLSFNIKEERKKLGKEFFGPKYEALIEYFDRNSGGQPARKEASQSFRNPADFLARIKELKRQQTPRTLEQQAKMDAELLADYTPAAEKVQITKSKKNKKKGKSGGRSVAKNPLKNRVTSPPEDCARAGIQISPLQKVVNEAIGNSIPSKDSHKLHGRVRRWDAQQLKGRHIAEWVGYTQLDKKGCVRQIINHMGIGLHKLLDSSKLYNDYVFESKRGPMMWCTIKPYRGSSITGKIHFGVATLENGRRLVYHRVFTEARPAEFKAFINAGAPEAFDVEESHPEEVQVGSVQATALADGNLKFRQAGHAYIKEFTIHSLL